MKSLVLLAALSLGCSVEVVHETENRAQTESLSTSDRNKTAVAVSILNEPESSPESRHTESATSSVQRSTTIVKVVVPEPSPEVVTPPPPPLIARCPEPMIRVTGSGNTVILGDVHLHHHEHKYVHIHSTPKPHPMRVDVRVKLNDRNSERERRRRMVERRIFRFFPRYGN